MNKKQTNGVSSSKAWHSAMALDRLARAEHLRLPSGATILAVRPEPLEWILSGRLPQHLLGAALEARPTLSSGADREMSREEILELAAFARQLVKASVVKPAIGEGPGEIALDEIPVRDRAFIFEWACRVLGKKSGVGGRVSGVGNDGSRELGVGSRGSGVGKDGSRESGVGSREGRRSRFSLSSTPDARNPTPDLSSSTPDSRHPTPESSGDSQSSIGNRQSSMEGLSSEKLERFR